MLNRIYTIPLTVGNVSEALFDAQKARLVIGPDQALEAQMIKNTSHVIVEGKATPVANDVRDRIVQIDIVNGFPVGAWLLLSA